MNVRKPMTDEQFVADIAKRITRRGGRTWGHINMAFAVASMIVGQIEDDGKRDITVEKFSAAFRGSVDRYRRNMKLGVDGEKPRA
jgi:hypothetical protein